MEFNTSDPKTIAAIKDFYEKGTDLPIKRSEVQFKGSPLFDELAIKKDESLTIHHAREFEGHVLFSWAGADPESTLYVPGTFRPALKYLTFAGSLPSSPLQLQTSVPWTIFSSLEPFTLELAFRPRHWQHQRLIALPHFESIHRFFTAALNNQQILLRFYLQGNHLGASTMDHRDLQMPKAAMGLLETLTQARTLAKHFGVDPVLPTFSRAITRAFRVVDELYAILFQDEYRMPVPNAKLSFTGFMHQGMESPRTHVGPMKIVQQTQTYSLFGQPVSIGPVQTQVTEMKLLRQTPTEKPGWLKLELVGTAASERIVRHKGVVYQPPLFPK